MDKQGIHHRGGCHAGKEDIQRQPRLQLCGEVLECRRAGSIVIAYGQIFNKITSAVTKLLLSKLCLQYPPMSGCSLRLSSNRCTLLCAGLSGHGKSVRYALRSAA